jgi:hypothetical protein
MSSHQASFYLQEELGRFLIWSLKKSSGQKVYLTARTKYGLAVMRFLATQKGGENLKPTVPF